MQQQGTFCDFSGGDSWVILSPIEQSIKKKIEAVGTPLKDWDININRGVLTGYNDAFIITTSKRDEILSNCQNEDERKRTAELIRPILRGRDIKRYGYNWAELWLINTHNGVKGRIPRVRIEDYPAIKAHLDHYWSKIKDRADQGDTPYNLRNCAYLEDFSRPKIIWKRIGSILRFSYDESGAFGLDSTCIATGAHIPYICCILNSLMGHYLLKDSPKTGTGDLLVSVQAINPVKVPYSEESEKRLTALLQKNLSQDQISIDEDVNRMVFSSYGLSKEEIDYVTFFVRQSQQSLL